MTCKVLLNKVGNSPQTATNIAIPSVWLAEHIASPHLDGVGGKCFAFDREVLDLRRFESNISCFMV